MRLVELTRCEPVTSVTKRDLPTATGLVIIILLIIIMPQWYRYTIGLTTYRLYNALYTYIYIHIQTCLFFHVALENYILY